MTRTVTFLVGLLATIVALLVGGAYLIARHSLPPLDGNLSIAGLRGPVEVVFDHHAVPHVYARDVDDLWLAAGVLHARERLWQMEVYRRAAAGRLSELFGQTTLSDDQRMLTLGLRRAATAEWTRTTPESKQRLERYAAGVNSVMTSVQGTSRPLEFQLLRLTPEPWSGIDSLAVAKLLSWRLAADVRSKPVRAELAARFGVGEAAVLMGTPVWSEQTPASALVETRLRPAPHAAVLPPLFDAPETTPGGLAWLIPRRRGIAGIGFVAGGGRTSSARPLLAADIHTSLELPSPWYEMHLVASGLNAIGATVPGLPYILHGHNERIAWALINSGVDVQDLYLERVDLGRRRYRFQQAWSPLDIERTDIQVRGWTRPSEFTKFATRHGPLVATIEGISASLRWTTLDVGDTGEAMFAINRAMGWPAFVAAANLLGLAPQRALYADVDGNFGEVLTGFIPERGATSVPLPGWIGTPESRGTVKAEMLLKTLNPASGYSIAETGNRLKPPDDRGAVHNDLRFASARLETLLSSQRLDTSVTQRMLNDVASPRAEAVLAWADRAAQWARKHKASPQTITALDRLRLWDRQVDSRAVVALFELFELNLWRRIFADEMDVDPFRRFQDVAGGQRGIGLYAVLSRPSSRWVDDIGTIDHQESLEEMVALAATDALQGLSQSYGPDSNWHWGRLHAASFLHALSDQSLLHRWWFRRDPISTIGDGTTIRAAGFDGQKPFSTSSASTFRLILDVGDWDRSRSVNSTGQSGHSSSQHYFDQASLWAQGRYRTMPYTRRAVEAARMATLLLVPRR